MQAPRGGNGKRSAADGNEAGNDLETRALFGNELETKHRVTATNGNESACVDGLSSEENQSSFNAF